MNLSNPSFEHVLFAGALELSVGDLHVENFGTWRDSEGRLIWGINDFDEALRVKTLNIQQRRKAKSPLG